MAEFKIESSFTPKGDQPSAIDEITNSLNANEPYTTLLGITGSGKTFTMANVIQSVNRPTLIMSHNKTLAAQLYGEMKQLFPNNGWVEHDPDEIWRTTLKTLKEVTLLFVLKFMQLTSSSINVVKSTIATSVIFTNSELELKHILDESSLLHPNIFKFLNKLYSSLTIS